MAGAVENDQQQSRLCSLPAEIRAPIFAYALKDSGDPARPYRTDRKYYRPGYSYHQNIDCSLLRTCKMVYRETRLLPLSVNEHCFWWFNGPWKHIDRNNRNTARWDQWHSKLNEDQKWAIQKVHVFAQQAHLEKFVMNSGRRFPFRTRCLQLTFRHSDWWSWESPPASSDRLGICPWRPHRTSCQQMLSEPMKPDLAYIKEHLTGSTWGDSICQILSLRQLIVEFEIDERKKAQLEVVVERAKSWIFPLSREDFILEWNGQLQETSWEGVLNLKDDLHFLKEQPVPENAPKRKYSVVTMVWNARQVESSTE